MSFDDSAGTGYSTMRGRSYPSIRQFTVFLENRVGQLLEVVRRFEGTQVRIVALSITDSGASNSNRDNTATASKLRRSFAETGSRYASCT